MISEQWVFAGATGALAFALVRILLPSGLSPLRHPAVPAAAILLLASLAVRAAFVAPTLVHADVAAPLLVDCALQFPDPCTNRGASYGQYGHWLLGAVAYAFGGDLNAVFSSMQIFGALNVVLMAILACRLSGSPYAGLLAVAVTATNPIFMRVSASEDMHTLGMFLALTGFVAMDIFASTRRPAALAAVVLSLGLMVNARQTFHVLAPCVFLLGLARGGAGLLRSPGFWGGGVVVLALLLQRILASDSGDLLFQMISVLSQPVLVPSMLRYHALFDFARYGLLPFLTVGAVLWAFVAGGMARAVGIVFLLNFVLTYPCGMPSPGVELAQRLATHTFGMLLCAMAGAALLESRVDASRRAPTALACATFLFVLPPFFPGWKALAELTPIHREYLAVEAAAAELPEEFTQVTLPVSDSNSYGGSRYAGLMQRMGKTVRTSLVTDLEGAARPWIFLENIECWTYSFYEVIGIEKETAREQSTFEHRWDLVLFGRQPSPLRPPAEVRPQCEPVLRSGKPIGPRAVITDVEDDPPFLFYATRSVPVQYHEIEVLPPSGPG